MHQKRRMQSIQTETLRIPVGDGTTMNGYLARPAGAGPHPGLIVFQEIFGVNEHVRDVARRFAEQGYVALAPDLFHRFAPDYQGSYDDIPASIAMTTKLVPQDLVADFKATFEAISAHSAVKEGHVGAIGYCMGGGMAFACNALVPLRAAVSYYGTPQPNISLERRREVIDLVRKNGKTFVDAEWAGANHGFFCDARSDYHADSAKQAWSLTLAFLKTHLGG